MIREQAMEWVIPALKHMWNEKNVKKILEALEQEPCRDVISREMALKECHDIVIDGERYRVIQEETLLGLPPVTPQPKTGHWIRMKAYEKWGCSECHTVFRFTFKEHNYCPNCGAKMVEPQEGEKRG